MRLLTILALTLSLAVSPATAKDKQSLHDRVLNEKEIRCAYLIYPPLFDKDLETGEFSGLSYDLMEALGKQLDVKINWVEEVGTDNAFSGLGTGRYDSVCIGFWAIPPRAKAANFTAPFYYEGVYAFARADDTRFDTGPETINTPETTIIVLEGEASQFIAQEDFPKAKTVTQPGLTGPAVRFMDVMQKKGDVTFNEITVYNDFNESNPGKIKLLSPEPIRLSSAGISLPKGEYDLMALINTTIQHMHNLGIVNKILKKYDPDGKIYLRLASPYKTPEG